MDSLLAVLSSSHRYRVMKSRSIQCYVLMQLQLGRALDTLATYGVSIQQSVDVIKLGQWKQIHGTYTLLVASQLVLVVEIVLFDTWGNYYPSQAI
jgi:hypothetical protein